MKDEQLGPHRFRQGRALHSQGKLAEAIAEYQAALALAPNHFDSLHYLGLALHQIGETQQGLAHLRRALELNPNDLGALVNCGELCRAAGMAFEAEVHLLLATALYPVAAEPLINLAALYLNQSRLEDCREVLRQARELQPAGSSLLRKLWALAHGVEALPQQTVDIAEIHFVTGRELNRRERWGLALPFLQRAVALRPEAAPYWLTLGIAHYDRDDKPRAIEAFTRAVELDPTLAIATTNLANAHMILGEENTAAGVFARAAALAPDESIVRYNQSLLMLKRDPGPEAWKLYDHRHKLPEARTWPGQRWNGEPIKGKRLLVHSEQGAGDTLQFMRFLGPLRATGAHITLAAQKSLSRLCSQVEGLDEFLLEGRAPEFDVRIELLSLPHRLGTTAANLPPPTKGLLIPRKSPLAERAQSLKGRKIGLCWAGATTHKNDWRRSAPLGLLTPLQEVPDVELISLQVGERVGDIAAEGWMGRIHEWSAELKDFADTAALIEALDIVVTADTAVAHLAATMGKPTWIMLPEPGEWRWGQAPESTVWYPSARLFRQSRPFAWTEVAQRVRDALLAQ